MKRVIKLSVLFSMLIATTFLFSGCTGMMTNLAYSNPEVLNENGELGYEEFYDLEIDYKETLENAEQANMSPEDFIQKRFQKFDTNNSGGLSKKEFKFQILS